MKCSPRSTLAALAVLLATAGGAGAQEGERPPIKPDLDMLMGGSQLSPQEEMILLFQAIEQRLGTMVVMLFDASAGDTSKLADVGQSGIDELLAQSSNAEPTGGVADLLAASEVEGRQVLEDIDRIIEIAAQNGGT